MEETQGVGEFPVPASELSETRFEKLKNNFWYEGNDIERERLGWEKREQNLKNRLAELANEVRASKYHDGNISPANRIFLKQLEEELLGLSKQ